MKCFTCGKEVSMDFKACMNKNFCPYCGNNVQDPKQKMAAEIQDSIDRWSNLVGDDYVKAIVDHSFDHRSMHKKETTLTTTTNPTIEADKCAYEEPKQDVICSPGLRGILFPGF